MLCKILLFCLFSCYVSPTFGFYRLTNFLTSGQPKPYEVQHTQTPSYGSILDKFDKTSTPNYQYKPTVETLNPYDTAEKKPENPLTSHKTPAYQQSSILQSGSTSYASPITYQSPNLNPITHIFEAGNQYLQKLASLLENPRLVKELLIRNQAIAHSIDRTVQENNQLGQLVEKMNLIQCPSGAKRYYGKCLQLFEVLADTYFNAAAFCEQKQGELPTSTLEHVEEVFEALDAHPNNVMMSVFWAIRPCDNQAGYAPTSLCSSKDGKEVKIDPKIKVRRDPHVSQSNCMRLAVSYGEYSLTTVPCTGNYHGTAGTACVACEFGTSHLIH